MDIKTILRDPHGAMADYKHATNTEPNTTRITTLIAELETVNRSSKETKTKKQLCARQFKDHKDNPEQIESLKREMQLISAELDSLNARVKPLEQEILQELTPLDISGASTDAQLPQQFQPGKPTDQTGERQNNSDYQTASIILLEDDRAKDWDNFVAQHPHASQYHLYAWRQIIQQSFGHKCFYLAALNTQGSIIGVLPTTWLNSKLFGSFAVSIPFFNYGGPLVEDQGIATDLMNHAKTIAESKDWNHIEIRTTTPEYEWPAQSRKVSMIRPLPLDEKTLDQEIGSKLRAQIKQGDRHRPDIKFGGKELLDDYYRVFSTHMRDLGTPVYSKQFFANILEALPDNSHIVVVSVNKKPVSTAFLLGHRDMMEIPWASTLRQANPMNINVWMYRSILGYAIQNGFSYFDFGRSTIDAGTYRFKKQWGAMPVEHHWYYWMKDAKELPELNPDNPKYKLLINVWKRLPVFISNLIGPHVIKNLP